MINLRAALVLIALAALSPDAFAQPGRWVRMESEHFVVTSDASEIATQETLVNLEAFDRLMRNRLGVAPDAIAPKLDIRLFRDQREFSDLLGGSRRDIAGFYTAGVETLSANAIFRDRYGMDAQVVVFHEYAHHFMRQHLPYAYPAWYVEGFAEFHSTAEILDDRIILGGVSEGRADWLNVSWMPLERLLTARPGENLVGSSVALFYAQSWFVVHYLLSDADRASRLRVYLELLRAPDADPISTFTTAFGVTPQQMHGDMLSRARTGRVPRWSAPRDAATPSIQTSRLDESVDALMALDLRVRLGLDADDAAAVLGEIRQRTTSATDPTAILVRARAEILLGDAAAGRALLEAAAQDNATNVEALYLIGRSYLARNGEPPSADSISLARRAFVRAFRANPHHVPTLFHYAMLNYSWDMPMSDDSLNVLINARNLAPQVWAIGFATANALMLADRYDEATAVLRPFAFATHDIETSRTAQIMLNAAEARRPVDFGAAGFAPPIR